MAKLLSPSNGCRSLTSESFGGSVGLGEAQSPCPSVDPGDRFREWDLKMHVVSELTRWHVGTQSRRTAVSHGAGVDSQVIC